MDQTDTIHDLDGAAPPTAQAEAASAAGRDSAQPFLGELARAMQGAAQRERKRIARAVADEAAEQVEVVRARAAAEAEELRRLANADLEQIQVWLASEIERIRAEADRQTAERHRSLEDYLGRHDSIISTEIEGVDVAVRDYDAILAAYFDELCSMTDPVDIARRAGSLPRMPDLDAVRAAARARAVDRVAHADEDGATDGDDPEAGASIGVMDPDAIGRSESLPQETAGTEPEPEPETRPEGVLAPVAQYRAEPPPDPLHIEGDVELASGPPVHASAAARVLRTIAPWALSSRGTTDRDGLAH